LLVGRGIGGRLVVERAGRPVRPVLLALFPPRGGPVAVEHQVVGSTIEIRQRIGDRSHILRAQAHPHVLQHVLRRIARSPRPQEAEQGGTVVEEYCFEARCHAHIISILYRSASP